MDSGDEEEMNLSLGVDISNDHPTLILIVYLRR